MHATVDGQTALKRLDFGVGQGEWSDEAMVGNDITVNVHIEATSACKKLTPNKKTIRPKS